MVIDRDGTKRESASADANSDMVKRLVDIAFTASALVIFAPVLAGIALAILLTDRRPVLFRQERLGQHRAPFVMLKFRTMTTDNDDSAHRAYVTSLLTQERPPDGGEEGLYKLANDPRVTRPGAFLRKTSLDELPQLFNVLRGEMSLVGPRPVLAWEADLFDARHLRRFDVKPGVTGLWQVSGRNALTMQQALDLDVEYVQRRSLHLDLAILMRTVIVVLRRTHAR